MGQIDESKAAFAQNFLNAIATNPLGMLSRRSLIRRDGISLVVIVSSRGFESFTCAFKFFSHASQHLLHFGLHLILVK